MNMLIVNQLINVMLTWFGGLIVYGIIGLVITVPLMKVFNTRILKEKM